MRGIVRTLSVFALAFLIAGAVRAEDKKPVEKKPDVKKEDVKKPDIKKEDVKKPASPFAGAFAFPKTIELTKDQQQKVDELKKEYTPKLEELAKKAGAFDTADRKAARAEILKKAKEDGKKAGDKEVQKAIAEAMKYTDDEKAAMKELGAARNKLAGEINKKKMELLTDEQKKAIAPKPKEKTEPKPKTEPKTEPKPKTEK